MSSQKREIFQETKEMFLGLNKVKRGKIGKGNIIKIYR